MLVRRLLIRGLLGIRSIASSRGAVRKVTLIGRRSLLVVRTLTLRSARVGGAGIGILRLSSHRLGLGVVRLRERVVRQSVATGHGPFVVAAVDFLIPDRSVAARELVLQVSVAAVRNTPVEVPAVLRISLESVALAQASCVL